MTTNKPGTVNQQPLYGCTSCYEECTWPASDLHVHDGECWCGLCWDERRWEFPDQPNWNDLEPYKPAEQQPAPDSDALLEVIAELTRELQRRFDGNEQASREHRADVKALVEALERISNMDSMSYHSLESAKIVARKALEAHRNQGSEQGGES